MRHPNGRAEAVDALLTAAVAVGLELRTWFGHGLSAHQQVVMAVASIAVAVPILFRRARPAAALLVAAALFDVQALAGGLLLNGPVPTQLGTVVVLSVLGYSVGTADDTLRGGACAAGAALMVASSLFLPGDGPITISAGGVLSALFYYSLAVVPGWFIGHLIREHLRRGSVFRRLAAASDAARVAGDAAAVADERLRIGGELQEIVSGGVNAMVIQAGAARLSLNGDAPRAREALLAIEQTGRQSLADLRRLLGVLRKDDDPAALTPQPGLGQVPALIDSLHALGLDCEIQVTGEPAGLTPGVDLVAYRFVEHALLAAAASGADQASLTIQHGSRWLRLEIQAKRPVTDLDAQMRPVAERLFLYDATVRVRQSSGGFDVHVLIPVDAVYAA